MRRVVSSALLAFPLVLLLVHWTVGQRFIAMDQRTKSVLAGQAAEAAGDWEAAVKSYDTAILSLPSTAQGGAEVLQLRMAREQARARTPQGLLSALQEMQRISAEAAKKDQVDVAIRDQLRQETGNTAYLAAWLMRRAGAPERTWGPYAKLARDQIAATQRQGVPAIDDNLERIAAFEQASDDLIRNRKFPDPALAQAFSPEDFSETRERPNRAANGRNANGQLGATGTGGGDYMKNRRGGS